MPKPTEKDIRNLDGQLWVKRLNDASASKRDFEEETGKRFPESESELLTLARELGVPRRLNGSDVDVDEIYKSVLAALKMRREATEAKTNHGGTGTQPAPDDGQCWVSAAEIKRERGIVKGTLSKWEKDNPKIRRLATPADRERLKTPNLLYVWNDRLIRDKLGSDPDSE